MWCTLKLRNICPGWGMVSTIATWGTCGEDFRVGQCREKNLGKADFCFFLLRSKFYLAKGKLRKCLFWFSLYVNDILFQVQDWVPQLNLVVECMVFCDLPAYTVLLDIVSSISRGEGAQFLRAKFEKILELSSFWNSSCFQTAKCPLVLSLWIVMWEVFCHWSHAFLLFPFE